MVIELISVASDACIGRVVDGIRCAGRRRVEAYAAGVVAPTASTLPVVGFVSVAFSTSHVGL